MNKQEIHKAIQFAREQGFQKGKLEQKKEELEFLIKKISVNHIIGRFEFLDIIKDRIKQLQKEIGEVKK